MSERQVVCTVCPLSCEITAIFEGGELTRLYGFSCPRGEKYAREELLNPTRILTTTIRVSEGALPLLPVKTSKPIPRELLHEAMPVLSEVVVQAPIRIGDVVVGDILGTGADVVATRSIPATEKQ